VAAVEAEMVQVEAHHSRAATAAQEMRVLAWPVAVVRCLAVAVVRLTTTVAVATVPMAAFACGLGDGHIHCGIDNPKIRRRDVYSP
jgi:hypothetical protein